MIALAQLMSQRSGQTAGMRVVLDEVAREDVERARGAAVVVQHRSAARAPSNEPDVVPRAAMDARRSVFTRWRTRGHLEACGRRVVDGDRGRQPRRQLSGRLDDL